MSCLREWSTSNQQTPLQQQCDQDCHTWPYNESAHVTSGGNQQNTTIYDPTDNKLKTTNYVKDKTNYTKFRVRFYNQNDLYLLRSITGLGEANYCKKQNAVVRDKTDLYENETQIFDVRHYLYKLICQIL